MKFHDTKIFTRFCENNVERLIRAAEIDLHFSVPRFRGITSPLTTKAVGASPLTPKAVGARGRAGGKKGTVTKKGTYILE